MIAGATAIGLVGIAPAAFAATAPPTRWHVVASPNPGGSAALGGVAAPAGPLAVTEHWDGLKWTVVKTGLPTTGAILDAVAAAPGAPSVAVGYRLSAHDTTLILRNAR